jgi:hypothetical protein
VDQISPEDSEEVRQHKQEQKRLRLLLQQQSVEDQQRSVQQQQQQTQTQNNNRVQVINSSTLKRLTILENKEIRTFKTLVDSAAASHVNFTWQECIDRVCVDLFVIEFMAYRDLSNPHVTWLTAGDIDAWKRWPKDLFFRGQEQERIARGTTPSQITPGAALHRGQQLRGF